MTVDQLDTALLAGALVLLVAIGAVRLAVGTGLPSLLLYVALGMVLGVVPGEDTLGLDFGPEVARTLGYAALIVILAEGGLTTAWADIRPAVPAAAILATLGVAVSVVVVALAARLALGFPWRLALLTGAVVSSTDAAAVFSVLRRVPLPRRLAGLLEAESGFNDAPVVIVVVALSVPATEADPWWLLLGLVGYELVLGGAVGLLVGRLGAAGIRRIALPSSGLYPITVLALAVTAYGAAAVANASGFLAVYLCALVLGNSRLPHRPATRGFAEGLAWLAQIGLFVMLGLLARPDDLLPALLPALAVGTALLLVARPLSVVVSTGWLGFGWREQVFLSWAGLRGAVPIVLATVPMVAKVPDAERLFDLVFVVVVVFTLVQAPLLPVVARRLGLVASGEARDVGIESSPLGHLDADLLQLRIPPASRLQGVEVFELRLPRDASITLIVRDGKGFVPDPRTPLALGDELLIVTTAAAREETERRLRAVSRSGRLASWFGERGR